MANKTAANKGRAKDQQSKPQNKLTSTLLTGAAISVFVVVLSFSYLALFERPTINQKSIAAQAQTLADSQVSLLDQALTQLRLRLASIALSEQLLAALDQNNEPLLSQYRQELQRAFPEAASTKLIALGPLGIASLNKESRELRNNIELDLLRSVSNGQNVEPEAYKYEDKWLFSLAEPIQSDSKSYASGALLVTLDEQYLRTLLSQLDNSLGQTALIQQFKNKQHRIATTGQSDTGSPILTADTSISHWQLSFAPSKELMNKSRQGSSNIWILLALCALTIALLSYYAKHTLSKLLMENLKLLMANNGKPFNLPGFATTASHLKERLSSATTVQVDEAEQVTEEVQTRSASEPSAKPIDLPESIFRAYDIRGLADTELSDEVIYAIGLAIGSAALDQGQQSIVVSADGRHSSPKIHQSLTKGIMDSGRDVIDIGVQPTPLMYFATHQLETQSGVMITGSHNPPEYNGIKVVINGMALSHQGIQALKQRIIDGDFSSGKGEYKTQDIEQRYIDYIINDVAIAQPLKLVLDAGNGVTGGIAPQLFEALGCEVIPLYCDVDGDFPNHHPDPSVEANLDDLKKAVAEHQADLGIAFDGDGDRLGVITAQGNYVPADRLLMLFAQDVVSRNPGADVLFDVKCTRNLNTLISNYGGRPIMWKSGHSYMKEKMLETGALLGGEFSGHIFFKERWFGFDDGMYAAARLVEILSTTDPDLDLQLEEFPNSISTAELMIATTETQKFTIIEQLINNQSFSGAKISTLDGLRADFPDGWGLVRASNTTPMLVLRFEADSEEALSRIQQQFKLELHDIDNSLQFGF
jgi:phosphomannomutase/phosphoglucomutase